MNWKSYSSYSYIRLSIELLFFCFDYCYKNYKSSSKFWLYVFSYLNIYFLVFAHNPKNNEPGCLYDHYSKNIGQFRIKNMT